MVPEPPFLWRQQNLLGASKRASSGDREDLAPESRDRQLSPVRYDSGKSRAKLRFLQKTETISRRSECLADDAICYEPLSAAKFPVKQEKYREFLRFQPRQRPPSVEKPAVCLRFRGEFPTLRNREF
jgi:hypothetical protein